MRNALLFCTVLCFAASVHAQGYATDMQTGTPVPMTPDGRYAIYPNGQAVPVIRSQHPVNCQQAIAKLERSHQIAQMSGRPLPRNMEASLEGQVNQLCR